VDGINFQSKFHADNGNIYLKLVRFRQRLLLFQKGNSHCRNETSLISGKYFGRVSITH